MKPVGSVSLVGSGPGDPGLLTLRGLRRIEEADLIIYDTLANPEHLRHARPPAQKICVGPGFRHRKISQGKINRLILQAARRGKKIVRLKGGDPYLFGRGGEEALILFKNRIPFEVVPGVTSAGAAAAYAGIPLTHREHNASVTFLTGHRAGDGALDSIDWKKIASLRGTLAIYMGFYNLKKIITQLVRFGMNPQTRAAVIEWGTLPRQKTCAGTLRNIVRLVEDKKLKAPCMIVIGDVVSLRSRLNWFEKLPLFGKRIVLTRLHEKSKKMREKLTEQGAEVLEFPTLDIKPPANFKKMDEVLTNVARFDWIVFTSPCGVDAFFDRLKGEHGKDARALGGIKIASVGVETSRALRLRGIETDLEPERFETQALAEAFKKRFSRLSGQKILLPRADIAPEALEEQLKKLGAETFRLTAYETHKPKAVSPEIKEALTRGAVDFITFTSASTVDHFVEMLGLKKVKALARHVRLASIGPVTSRALKRHGLKPSCQARIFTPDGLVEALIREGKK